MIKIKSITNRLSGPWDKLLEYKTFIGNANYRKNIIWDYNKFHLHKFKTDQNSISPWLYDSYDKKEREKALTYGIGWLLNSQKLGPDDGSSSYNLKEGWTLSGYPETTGYIIPTLVLYSKLYNRPEILENVKKMGEWLLMVQKPSGGWPSGYAHQNRNEIVFNTGQVIRGMVSLYEITKQDKYLQSMERACDWLCKIQSPEGFWANNVYLNAVRVYDSYVAHPILLANKHLNKPLYVSAVKKHINWILDKKQHKNGWFEDTGNTKENNESPILHTISYTIDGIMECGYALNDEKMIEGGKKAADFLYHKFSRQKYLFDKFDKNWSSKGNYINLTGSAQLAIIWSRMYKKLGKVEYLNAAMKINDLLIFTQNRFENESVNTKGAIAGSFPIWGDYQKYSFPNWATKYFCDSLMLEKIYTDEI